MSEASPDARRFSIREQTCRNEEPACLTPPVSGRAGPAAVPPLVASHGSQVLLDRSSGPSAECFQLRCSSVLMCAQACHARARANEAGEQDEDGCCSRHLGNTSIRTGSAMRDGRICWQVDHILVKKTGPFQEPRVSRSGFKDKFICCCPLSCHLSCCNVETGSHRRFGHQS